METCTASVFDAQHSSRFLDTFCDLLKHQRMADVCFICEDGHKVRAHQTVLAISSNFLKNVLLEFAGSKQSVVINLPDVSAFSLKLVLLFLYEGATRLDSFAEYKEIQSVLTLLGIEPDNFSSVTNLCPTTNNSALVSANVDPNKFLNWAVDLNTEVLTGSSIQSRVNEFGMMEIDDCKKQLDTDCGTSLRDLNSDALSTNSKNIMDFPLSKEQISKNPENSKENMHYGTEATKHKRKKALEEIKQTSVDQFNVTDNEKVESFKKGKTEIGETRKSTLNLKNDDLNESIAGSPNCIKEKTTLSNFMVKKHGKVVLSCIAPNTRTEDSDGKCQLTFGGIKPTDSNFEQTLETRKPFKRKANQAAKETGISHAPTPNKKSFTPNVGSCKTLSNKQTQPVKKHHVMFTMLDEKVLTKCRKIILSLGGVIEEDNPSTCTILVTDKVRRTIKFLSILAQGKPIVSTEWLEVSGKTNAFKDPVEFLIQDNQSEKIFDFKLSESLTKARDAALLSNYSVYVTPSVKPEPFQMKVIIESAGGKYLDKPPTLWNESCFIVSTPEDKSHWPEEDGGKFKPKVVSAEIILRGVLQQKLDFDAYKLK